MKYHLATVVLLALVTGLAQNVSAGLPPLFDAKPRALAPAHVVAEFPAGTFLENVLALPDGSLLVNSHLDGIIYRVSPATGTHSVFSKVPGTIAGIAAADKGAFIVSGGSTQSRGDQLMARPRHKMRVSASRKHK